MALPLDQLTAITQNKIVPKLFDNVFDSNILLKKMLASGQYVSQDGGTSIDLPLNYATTEASGWYSGVEQLSTTDNENVSAARYLWANAYAGISISEEDELKNSGAQGILKLLASKSMIAEKTIKDIVGTGLYSDGTNAKSITGLRDIVAVDQTVGAISQADNTWWQAQVDSTSTVMSLSALNAIYDNASIDNEKPDMITASRANYQRYYNLLTPLQRFTDTKTASGGFENLLFNSVPFVSDSKCPANHVFMLNMKHLWLYYHPERNFSVEPFQKPIDQQAKVSRILVMLSFGSSNNRLHGKLSALTA
jgi:hypothetical protein